MFQIIAKARASFHLVVLESIHISTKKPLLCRQKKFFSHQDSIGNILYRQATLIGQPQQLCARVSDWPISIHNWVYIFPCIEFSIYVLTIKTLKRSFSLLKCLLFSKPLARLVSTTPLMLWSQPMRCHNEVLRHRIAERHRVAYSNLLFFQKIKQYHTARTVQKYS